MGVHGFKENKCKEEVIPKMVVSKSLNTAGWYRVAQYPSMSIAKSFIVNIGTNGESDNSPSIMLAVNIGKGKSKISKLNSVENINIISKARIVEDNNVRFLEVYYVPNRTNTAYVDLINQNFLDIQKVTMLDFEAPTDTATVLDELTIETNDTGWVTLNDCIEYRKKNDVVYIKGIGSKTVGNGSYTEIGILPTEIRPPKYFYFSWSGMGGDTTGQSARILESGLISLYLPAGKTLSSWGFFVSYPI